MASKLKRQTMIIEELKRFKNFRNFPGEVGVEIETETKEEYQIPAFSFWTSHQDGSLRDFGIEYVLKQPLKVEGQLEQALTEFREKTQGIKFIQDSLTTSVHIHLNFLDQSFQTLGNFLVLYTILENILIRYSGEDRLSNLFCLPICDAEENYKNMMRMASGIAASNAGSLILNAENCKYAALNLATLGNYGSLEVRSHKGVTDTDRILEWVQILHSIKRFAQQNITPQDIITEWKNKGPELLTDIFGPYRKAIDYKDSTDLVERNFWYGANIAYAVKDWRTVFKPKKKPEAKSGDLDHIANQIFQVGRFENLDGARQRDVLNRFIQNQGAQPWNQGGAGLALNMGADQPFRAPRPRGAARLADIVPIPAEDHVIIHDEDQGDDF